MNIIIANPPVQIRVGVELIEKMKRINNFQFDIDILLDYTLDCRGEYRPYESHEIRVNPFNCSSELTYCYPEDGTIFGVMMHEFAHFLCMTYFVDFQKSWLEAFPEKRLLITEYEAANEDYDEEIAEIVSLYVRNNYMLKLISPDHYNFLRAWFKSPVVGTVKNFIFMYNKLPPKYKKKLQTKWGIFVNHAEQTVHVDKKTI